MPRPRQRVCLENGLKLDLNALMRQGCVVAGADSVFSIAWSNSYGGEEVATSAQATASMRSHEGHLRIQIDDDDNEQMIVLTPRSRRLGGQQWYFVCPVLNRCASVLWRPPGETRFCSRQAWGRWVAYASQFESPVDRAWRGQAKIKSRLIGDCDPDEWDLPPKPKWMRWQTYKQWVERFDDYEEILDQHFLRGAAMHMLNRG
jgi:hypothetical protein